jgi:hypothetical protein
MIRGGRWLRQPLLGICRNHPADLDESAQKIDPGQRTGACLADQRRSYLLPTMREFL